MVQTFQIFVSYLLERMLETRRYLKMHRVGDFSDSETSAFRARKLSMENICLRDNSHSVFHENNVEVYIDFAIPTFSIEKINLNKIEQLRIRWVGFFV